MTFNETLIFLLLFLVVFNALDFLRLYSKASYMNRIGVFGWSFRRKWIVAIITALLVLSFVIVSCYWSYSGFRTDLTVGASILGSSMFIFADVVLLKLAFVTVRELIR